MCSVCGCSVDGNGQIYWSYGRQDNGSLAMIPITVEDALLDYGLCDTARAHIGYYFDNYLTADGQIKYPQNTNWKTWVDSVGDIGWVRCERKKDTPLQRKFMLRVGLKTILLPRQARGQTQQGKS